MCYSLRPLLEVSAVECSLEGDSEHQWDTDVKFHSIQAKNYFH